MPINAVRANKKINVPVVMTREAVAAVLSRIDGTAPLVAKLLYGSGLRTVEAVRLRVKDIGYHMKPRTVRVGKGDQDRCTTAPATLTPWLQHHPTELTTRRQQQQPVMVADHAQPQALWCPHPLGSYDG